MKITHAKFLKLLAAELGQDEKITGIHLNGLISEIINTTAEGKPYEVPGFGTFKLFEGQMMFTADARLAAEINYNYEGMPEIDVNEARSIVDEELDEQDGTPVIKSDTLIEDEGVAGEEVPSPQDEDPFADLDDESYQNEAEVEDPSVESPQVAQDDEEDPFEVDEPTPATGSSFVLDLDAIEEEPSKQDGGSSADDMLDSFIARKTGKTDVRQDEATSENDEPEISLDDAFDYSDMQADADSIDEDAAVADGVSPETGSANVEDELPAEGASEDSVPSKRNETDAVASSFDVNDSEEADPGTEQSDDRIDTFKDVFAEQGDEESTVADTASPKPVKKPEPVVKVGNIVGKKTPSVEITKAAARKTESAGAESGAGGADLGAVTSQTQGDAFAGVSDLNMEGDVDNAAVSKPLPSDRKKGESNVLLMLTIAAAVVLVALGVWWYLGSRPAPLPTAGVLPEAGLSQAMLDEVTATEQEPVTPDVSAPVEPEPSEADRALAAMTNWEEPRPVGSPAPVDEDGALGTGPAEGSETGLDGIAGASTSPFGLRGQPQPMEGRVFSIVVHSLPSRIDGNIQCDEIARLGLRCVVVEARVDNRITYRVGIGQFQTYAEAQRRVEDLPEPYRSTNFPARIN